MGFFSATYLTNRRTEWMNTIVKFQYQVSGTWYDAVVNSRSIVGNTVKLLVHIPNVPETAHTITGVRIIDTTGAVGGSQVVSIERSATQGVLTTFEFPIQEV